MRKLKSKIIKAVYPCGHTTTISIINGLSCVPYVGPCGICK